MKRNFIVFLTCALIASTFFLYTCKSTESTMGTLTITAMQQSGASSSTYLICIGSSRQNLDNKNYIDSLWSNSSGSVIFRDLQPGIYWYRVKGWDDYGASQVYSGFDESVILWLNSPSN